MYIKLGFFLFTKKLFPNLVVILQLGLSLVIANFLIGRWNYGSADLYTMRHFPSDNTFFNMVVSSEGDTELRMTRVNSLIEQNRNLLDCEQIRQTYAASDSEYYFIAGYGEKTLAYWNPADKSVNLAENTGAGIPCLAYSDFHAVGDKIHSRLLEDPSTELTFDVVGVIDAGTKLLNISTSSNKPDFSMFLEERMPDTDYLICDYSLIPGFNSSTYCGNSILYFSETASPEDLQTLVHEFNKYSWTRSISELRQNSLDEMRTFIKPIIPLFICLFLLGIVSTLCLGLLNAYKSIKTFSIYYILGMNWSGGVFICLGYILCIAIGSVALTLPFMSWVLSGQTMESAAFLLRDNNVLISIVLLTLIIGISLIPCTLLIKKENPLKSLKDGW